MKILVTNDDGYKAKGLKTLVKIMRAIGDVTVIAPKSHQSGMSMAVSLGKNPIAYKYLGEEDGAKWSYLDGTPASCVKYGLNFPFLKEKPGLVVSGINHGSNASTAACYSGTLGAAEEAALNGIAAVGVSLDSLEAEANFSAVEQYLPQIIKLIISRSARKYGLYYNINFPDSSPEEIKGVRVCEMGLGKWEREFKEWKSEALDEKASSGGSNTELHVEEGEILYKMAGEYMDYSFSPERADNILVNQGYISIVPHNLASTDVEELISMDKEGFNKDF